jgi:lipid-A-disaccharide synthase
MVNLIAGRRVVPELLQFNLTAANLLEAILPLLGDTLERAQMIANLAEVRERLILPPSDPIQRAAEVIRQLLEG